MSILLFIAVILVLVFVHELGHFFFAKITGCKVDEFSVGFKPALWQKKYGETNYVLGIIPLGGYVKIWGDVGSKELESNPEDPRAFCNRIRPVQILVLLGGIIFNVIFAWALLVVVFMMGTEAPQSMFPQYELDNTQVQVLQVLPDSSAAKSGILVGDIIISLNAGRDEVDTDAGVMREFIANHTKQDIFVSLERDGEYLNKTVRTFEYQGRDIIGFGIDTVGIVKLNLPEAVSESARTIKNISQLIFGALFALITSIVSTGEGMDQFSGPVGIASYAQESFNIGASNFLYFMALLSLNLAAFNLLPIPALDGGRIVFVLIESCIRRRINHSWFLWINLLGFVFLIALMLYVTYKDVLNLL